MIGKIVRVLCALCFLVYVHSAHSFTPDGHEIIEAAAYKYLIDNNEVVSELGVTGKIIIIDLVNKGYLYDPILLNELNNNTTTNVSLIVPVVGSGVPDLVASRQLSHKGQCYHFMASVSDVYKSETLDTFGYPVNLSTTAYVRCLELMTSITEKIKNGPLKSHLEYQNAYAMIHIIVDSFSAAHVVRRKRNDSSKPGDIKRLKAWLLTGVFSYTFHWDGWKYFNTDTHHNFKDEHDDYFYHAHCPPVEHSLQVDVDCLTENGIAARNAVVDYLILLWSIDKKNEEKNESLFNPESNVSKLWQDYVSQHFYSESIDFMSSINSDTYLDWRPTLNLGVQDYNGNLGVKYEQYFNINEFLPLEFGISFEYVNLNNGFATSMSLIPNMRIGINENLILTIKPLLSSDIHFDTSKDSSDIYSSIELGLYFDERYWVSLNRTVGAKQELFNGTTVTFGMSFDIGDISNIDWFSDNSTTISAPNGNNASISYWESDQLTTTLGAYSNYSKFDNYFYFGGYNSSLSRYFGIGFDLGVSSYAYGRRSGLRHSLNFEFGVGASSEEFQKKSITTLYPQGDPSSSDILISYSIGKHIYGGKLYIGWKPLIARIEGIVESNNVFTAETSFILSTHIFKKLIITLELPFASYNEKLFDDFGSVGLKLGMPMP